MNDREHVWAIVLAGGDGLRLSEWTADHSGRAVPKQYCSFGRPRCMLRWGLDRAAGVVPRERVLIVVAREHRRFWEPELSDFPAGNVIVQPQNRGTAAGLLLPLSHPGLRRDTRARVLVLASDHHVGNERKLRESLDLALDVRGRKAGRVLLLGMTPSDLDDDYGWIVPASRPADGIRRVAHFAEKPGPDEARALMKRGALVNSLMLVAQARLFRQLYEEALPETFVALRDALGDPAAPESLDAIYARIPNSDLSRDVLAPSVRRLSVVHVPACGWSDLGTPHRLRTFGIREPDRVHRGTPVGRAPGGSIPLVA